MRFHVVGLPHTQTNAQHNSDVFTMKVLHFCQMMQSLGHEVYHYGVEGSDNNTQIMSQTEQVGFFGKRVPGQLYDIDWTGKAPYWSVFNKRAAAEINKRKQPGDIVCVISGSLNHLLAEAVEGGVLISEYGIGYNGCLSRKPSRYRIYESYAHMHKILGAEAGYDPNGYFYDAVIPNYLNPSEYPFNPSKGDYFLYVGRLIKRKGIHIAVETCKRLGVKLKIAGQGCLKVEGNRIYCTDGEVYEGDNLEYVGFASGDKKVNLYQNAIATFAPTLYTEPFGAIVIESQMTGTPVITTDWGAYPETVDHGKTGFRCHTLEQFMWAAQHAKDLDKKYIHEHAVATWSMERVKYMYQEYFQMLSSLWDAGWYTMNDDRKEMSWLNKY